MSIVFVILSLFLASLGALIWRFKLVGLLSNVDKDAVVDKNGLARWAGICMLLMAAIAMSVSAILRFVDTDGGELIVCMLFMFTSQMTTVVYLSGPRRYTK